MIDETSQNPCHGFTTRQRIKTIIFGLITGLAYFGIMYYAFGPSTLRTSLLFVLIFFVCFHLFYLQITKVSLRYLAGVLLLLTIIECAVIGLSSYLLCLAILVINAGIWILAYYLQGQTRDKVSFNSWGYANTGGYIFTVFITIGYSLLLLGLFNKFPLSCQDLSNASNNVVNFFTRPMTDGAKKITADTKGFRNTTVGDVVTIGKDLSLQTSKVADTSIIQKINIWKKNLVDQALSDNKIVSMGICDYVLTQVNKIYNNPAFLTSVVLLLFILLYSFVRIVFWVMAGVTFVLFKILYRSKVYRVKKVMKEVDEIE